MSPWLNLVSLINLGFFALYLERPTGALYVRYGRSKRLKRICKGTSLKKV